ncbi:hypothetical protein IFM89_018026, partial [Coptis chinensis]
NGFPAISLEMELSRFLQQQEVSYRICSEDCFEGRERRGKRKLNTRSLDQPLDLDGASFYTLAFTVFQNILG